MRSRRAGNAVVRTFADGHMSIELSAAQTDQVVRAASDRGQLSALMSSMEGVREALATGCPALDDARLSRSLILGLLVLACFPADGSTVRNADVAAKLDMHLSTTHRYVTTLVVMGLLEQDPRTRRYRLAR